MNIKLSAVSDKNMDLTCSACGHEFSYKIADLMLTTSDDTTTHEVRQRAVCRSCGVREMESISWCRCACMALYVSLSAISSATTSLRG